MPADIARLTSYTTPPHNAVRRYHLVTVARLRQLFNRWTYPGWVLLIIAGLQNVWWALGVWARVEFFARKMSNSWPLLGDIWLMVSPHLTVQNALLVAGVIWIGVGVRRAAPLSASSNQPQLPVVMVERQRGVFRAKSCLGSRVERGRR